MYHSWCASASLHKLTSEVEDVVTIDQLVLLSFDCHLCVRVCGHPVQHQNKQMFTSPLVVISGKKEPKSLAAYLQRLMEDLKECGPSEGSHDCLYHALLIFVVSAECPHVVASVACMHS